MIRRLFVAGAAALATFAAPAFGQHHMDHSAHSAPSNEARSKANTIQWRYLSNCPPLENDEGMPFMVNCTRSAAVADGSGTSRLPGNQAHFQHGNIASASGGDGWNVMAHGFINGVYTDQAGPRGDDKAYLQSMIMLMGEKDTGWGRIQLRSMNSLEPLMDNRGYPSLFATGETADGNALVDRQHPHDFFMELSARVDVDISDDASLFAYGGPVAEPALGPSVFMHRGSAKLNPEAPITHHWFDSTHITYGVVTAGVATRHVQIEGSVFRGREPDEERWGIETPKLDSWSARASWNPAPNWAMQVSTGRLKSPEASHPDEDEQRTTASLHYANRDGVTALAAFSNKDVIGGTDTTAWIAEANWDVDEHHTVFGRFENLRNAELFPDHSDRLHNRSFRVSKLQAGYAYRLPVGPLQLALGGTVAAFAKPDVLDSRYGSNPMGYTVFVRLSLGEKGIDVIF